MQEKDITQKMLESNGDVFADIVNVLMFYGKILVTEGSLTEADTGSIVKFDGGIHSQYRDVAKYWHNSQIKIAMFGLENQTAPDKLIPLRTIGYDGAEYVRQCRKDQRNKEKYPVITLVLYLGYDRRWTYPTNLLGVLDVDENLRPYVNDFKVNLFEIAFLDREVIDSFQSDFRILADYLYQMRVNKEYVADRTVIKHVDELLNLMSAMTGDNRFEETINDLERKENVTMCEVLDRVEARGIEKGRMEGIEEGRIEGREEGRREGILHVLTALVKEGIIGIKEAAARANISEDEFKKYLDAKL